MKINRELLKNAFVAAGDPMMTGDPGAAAGGDPAAAAGGDPAAAAGGDPAAAAAAAPPPGPDPAMIQQMVQQAVQQAMMSQGGGGAAGGAGGGLKPKIDVNVELMQIKKLLARIADSLGVQIPAAEMVATPDDLNQMAMQQQQGQQGGAAGGAGGAIPPIQPMKAAEEEWEQGTAFTEERTIVRQSSLSEKAAAIMLRNKVLNV